ncbi:unnamed protein product [Mucor fragilis]
MKFLHFICLVALLLIPALMAQDYFDQEEDDQEQFIRQETEEEEEEGGEGTFPSTVDAFDTYDVYQDKFFPAVAVASFTGPSIVGEFSFYQDSNGQVVATGAFQKGLLQDREYEFRFHQGPNCEDIGEVVMAHYFETMHVLDVGGTPPIQEPLNDIHLTGKDGYMGLPWVLSDGVHDLACVVLKGNQAKK